MQLVKILAFDIGHGDELHAGDFAHVVNAKDVLVRDLAGEDQFLLEAVQGILFPYDTLADYLNRNRAIQLFVSRFIDAAHAALTEERLDAVTRAEIASRLKDGRVHRMNGFGVADGHRSAAFRAVFDEIRICSLTVGANDHSNRQGGSEPGF